jgi:hypothetical protein
MDEQLIPQIRDHILTQQRRPIPFPPANHDAIADAESRLGFHLPPTLKSLYLSLDNGGFGPGRGGKIIGVQAGHTSSAGTLVDQYNDIRNGAQYLGLTWPDRLLPFCDWGCNTFSCVDCSTTNPDPAIFLATDCNPLPQNFTLNQFINLWLTDADILNLDPRSKVSAQIINPFTGAKATATARTTNNQPPK